MGFRIRLPVAADDEGTPQAQAPPVDDREERWVKIPVPVPTRHLLVPPRAKAHWPLSKLGAKGVGGQMTALDYDKDGQLHIRQYQGVYDPVPGSPYFKRNQHAVSVFCSDGTSVKGYESPPATPAALGFFVSLMACPHYCMRPCDVHLRALHEHGWTREPAKPPGAAVRSRRGQDDE